MANSDSVIYCRQRSRRGAKKRVTKTRSSTEPPSLPCTSCGSSASICRDCGTFIPVTSAGRSAASRGTASKVASLENPTLSPGKSAASADPPAEPCPACGSCSRLLSCDVTCPAGGVLSSSHSSSDLSSPNESCYSFVRRALQVDHLSCCYSDSSSSSTGKQVLDDWALKPGQSIFIHSFSIRPDDRPS